MPIALVYNLLMPFGPLFDRTARQRGQIVMCIWSKCFHGCVDCCDPQLCKKKLTLQDRCYPRVQNVRSCDQEGLGAIFQYVILQKGCNASVESSCCPKRPLTKCDGGGTTLLKNSWPDRFCSTRKQQYSHPWPQDIDQYLQFNQNQSSHCNLK